MISKKTKYGLKAMAHLARQESNKPVLIGQISETEVEKEVVALVREKIGAVAALRNIVVVKRLPKTRSGKILRKLIRTMLDGKEFQIPSTIDDEAIIGELQEKFEEYRK